MKIHAEAYGKNLRDNSITEALRIGNWHFRLGFSDEEGKFNQSLILSWDEANQLIEKIKFAQKQLISNAETIRIENLELRMAETESLNLPDIEILD